MREEREHNRQISNPLGRPAGEVEMMETDNDSTPNLNISIKTCGYSKAEIQQGVEHVCNQTERRRNMANALKSASRGTLETVVGEGLKEVQRRQEKLASPDSTLTCMPNGRPKLPPAFTMLVSHTPKKQDHWCIRSSQALC